MIGDPSGRNDMRSMMTKETIDHNVECFKKQMSRFIDFSDGKALLVNNADWLLDLNYVDVLREVGPHFSVNRMLTAECYKQRLEKGLSFLEFNYMLMQGYDFYRLYKDYGCKLECGGDDQWSNMLAGADLIRRKEGQPAFAMTFSLLTTSDGKKMGKTQKGAVWIDEAKTSPYEFYQYWRNIDDSDVEKCMKLLTFMDLSEIEALCRYKDERMNVAKARLAYEVTKLVHGEEKAKAAEAQTQGAFGGGDTLPTKEVENVRSVIDAMIAAGVAPSRSEARRLIEGGGIKVDDDKVDDVNKLLTDSQLANGFVLHKGKKVHLKVVVK